MPKPMDDNSKVEVLREHGSVNPRADEVKDPLFQENDFFDPRDLVQVKYEMLRKVNAEKVSVTKAAENFGFSRVAFYKAQNRFNEHGLAGLVPQQRGPKQAHKMTPEVVEFLEESISINESFRTPDLVELVKSRFGISVHPRSIERALDRSKKKAKKTSKAL